MRSCRAARRFAASGFGAFRSREAGSYIVHTEGTRGRKMGSLGSRNKLMRVRLATALPFTAGVFLGTLMTLFLVITLRSIDDETTGYREDERTGVVAMPSSPRGLPPKKTREEADTVQPKELVLYSVVVDRSELQTRGLAAHKTWASGLGRHVNFYLHPPGGDADISFAYKNRISLVALASNHRRTSSNGVIGSLLDVCKRQLGRYHWYARIDDRTYVRPTELENILSTLNSSQPHFIGHRVLPHGREMEELGLREGEGYCSQMGYVMSAGALQLVCPHLQQCWENARSENEDVEVARCLRGAAGVNCTSSQEAKELFYKAQGLLSEEELQLGQHTLNPSLQRALLLSPLTHPEHFYHMHYYYVRQELNTSRLAATRLRLHMIETADRAAESDNYAHTSVHQSPSWTRLGVNSPYHPQAVGDTIHCLSLDSQYRYTEAKHYPSHPLSGLLANDLGEIIGAVSRKYGTQTLPINSVLQRVDPQRGIDYFIHALEKNAEGEYNSRFMHALRESEPLQVTSMHPANYHTTKVNFVVPTAAVSKAFQRFMISFENNFLARSPPELVGLFVILYSDGKVKKYSKNLFGTTTLLRLYKKKYPAADLRLVTTNRPFSRKESIELASREHPAFELLFLADIHVDFSHQFLERCRMNAIENHQVYFPAVFSPYDPSEFYKDRLLHPHAVRFKISAQQGSWMHENYHLACLYNYDLTRVLESGRELKERDWSLIHLVLRLGGGLQVFRAVEPGLVSLWQDGCSETVSGSREETLCRKLGLATSKDS